jgi:cytoskeletal protein CcmA (bactofilin family)
MGRGWFDKKRSETGAGEWTGFLERGVKLEGKLEAPGTFRIDSSMKGTLVSDETLVLGEHAVIEGEIIGNQVIIAGRFNGIIRAKGKVQIQPHAIVTGEVQAPCLVIEPGGVFDGQCHMLAEVESAKPIAIPIRSAGAQSRG